MTTTEFIKYWNAKADQVIKEIASNKWIYHLTEYKKEDQNANK